MSIKYSCEEIESWIKSFQPNYEKQKWHRNKVYHPSDLINYNFFKPHKNYKTKINPKDIIGTDYGFGDNWNNDWGYRLCRLKRLDEVINNFKDKKSLIAHIHNNKARKSVLKYGKHYFISLGQHRLCLAKHLELEQVEVYVQEYKLDKKIFLQEKNIEKNYSRLIDFKLVDNKYKPDLNSDFLCLNLAKDNIFIHKSLIKNVLNRFEQLISKQYIAIPNILKSFYKPLDNYHSYRNSNELYTLDYKILKHIRRKRQRIVE